MVPDVMWNAISTVPSELDPADAPAAAGREPDNAEIDFDFPHPESMRVGDLFKLAHYAAIPTGPLPVRAAASPALIGDLLCIVSANVSPPFPPSMSDGSDVEPAAGTIPTNGEFWSPCRIKRHR